MGAYKRPSHPANFLNHLKTKADIDAILTVPYSASIWHPQNKISAKSVKKFWENTVLVTSCYAILGKKTANIQMLLECRMLKYNVTSKHQKMSNYTLHITIFQIFDFLLFLTRKSKFRFFKNTAQNRKLYIYPKKRNIYCRTMCH